MSKGIVLWPEFSFPSLRKEMEQLFAVSLPKIRPAQKHWGFSILAQRPQ